MRTNSAFKIVCENLKNEKKIIIFLILKTLSTGLGVIVPYLVGVLIDHLDNVRVQNIIYLGALLVGSLVIESFVTYKFSLLGQMSAINVRNKLWDKILKMRISYYDKSHSGEVSSRIINDTSSLSTFITESLPDFYTSLLSLFMMVSVLFYLDRWLGGIFCLIFPLIILVMLPASDKIRNLSLTQQSIYAKLNEMITETVEHIKFVKAYGAEEEERKKVEKKMKEWYQNTKQYNIVQAVLSPIMAGVTTFALFVVCGIGAYRVQMGYVTTGTIIIFALYLIDAVEPVEMLGNFIMEYRELQGALYEVNRLFEQKSEETRGEVVNTEEKVLAFENVQFSYGEDTTLVNVSFSVRKNEKVAIVGKSGVGKTTIFSLIERFYEISNGEILWGDKPIESLCLPEWRNNIGYVFQDKVLVSGTIRENMVYGIERDISEIELKDAAKKANIYDFIELQEKKFDTYVGEKGELLSGGQQQRIAIARMFLRNPNILMLDEVTANLDADSEQQILNSLKELYKGRITLIIAHKIQTVMDADQILVMQDGCIVGHGTHEELIKSNSYYQNVIKYELSK